VLGLLVTLLVPSTPLPARAQELVPTVRLVVSELAAVVGPGTRPVVPGDPAPDVTGAGAGVLRASVLVVNDGALDLDALDLVVEVHDRVDSRTALREALDGDGPTDAGRVVVQRDLATVPAGGVAQVAIEVTGEAGGWATPGAGTAVHPVVLSVLRGSVVVEQVRTAVVWVERRPPAPLDAVVVLPINAPPAQLLGSTDPTAPLRPGAAVDRLVRTAEVAPRGLATLAVDAAVLEDLTAADAAGVPDAGTLRERLLTLVSEAETGPVSLPYAAADVAALASSNRSTDLAALAVGEGRRRLRILTGRAPANVQLAVGAQSPASLDLVPVDVLVSRWDAAAGIDLAADPAAELPSPVRSSRTASGRSLTVLVGDPWLGDALAAADGAAGWPVDAHRIVAESAVMAADADAGAPGDVLVLVAPLGWSAPGDLGPLLVEALGGAPWLAPADPGTVAAAAGATGLPSWTVVPAPTDVPDLLVAELGAVRERLSGLGAATSAGVDPIGAAGPSPTDDDVGPPIDLLEATDELLRAATTWPVEELDPGAGERVATVRAAVDAALGTITVPDDATVTLTSDRGAVPVTVQHSDGVGLQVLVEVAAQGRLTFSSERQLVPVPPTGTATVSFEATALGRGTFPVVVSVFTPDGGVLLERSVLSVRATAVSRPALLAIVLVVLILLLLGGRRRGPRLRVVDELGPTRRR
jgi:hypothetical protein